jgi:hypothetical protein
MEHDATEVEYFCGEHCFEHGYCHGCGYFWAGVNAFDFDRGGLCPHCRDQVNADFNEPSGEDYDAEFYHLQDIAGGVDFD